MFMAEIGIMRKLSHPYIIRFLGCGVLNEAAAPGTPVRQVLAVVRPAPTPRRRGRRCRIHNLLSVVSSSHTTRCHKQHRHVDCSSSAAALCSLSAGARQGAPCWPKPHW